MSLDQMRSEESGIKKEVAVMQKISEMGKYEVIKSIFTKRQFPEGVIFDCISRCLDNFENKKEEYFKSMEELLLHINPNYKSNSEGKTILMLFCERGEPALVSLFLKQSKNTIKHEKTSFIPKLNDIFSQFVFNRST